LNCWYSSGGTPSKSLMTIHGQRIGEVGHHVELALALSGRRGDFLRYRGCAVPDRGFVAGVKSRETSRRSPRLRRWIGTEHGPERRPNIFVCSSNPIPFGCTLENVA